MSEVEPAAAVSQAGGETEIVVRGRVLRPDDSPHPHAVVTAVRLTGEPLDWSRADNAGAFSLALPGRDRYLVIANADGWTPRSQVTDFADPDAGPGGPARRAADADRDRTPQRGEPVAGAC